MKTNYPAIYIICHKHDYFLTKILVSSIRYYYPETEIFLIKDQIHGPFSTSELEKYFKVKIVILGKRRFGWTSAKIFLLLSKKLKGEKIFLLDSDVIFVGKVLDLIAPYVETNDFIISPEFKHKPGSEGFTNNYYDFDWFKDKYSSLTFPGFTFNTGNIMITAGTLNKSEISPYFDVEKFPYWTDLGRKKLPTRDQSLLNVLLPIKVSKKIYNWKNLPFMWWYREEATRELKIEDVVSAKFPYIIHWAGGVRVPFLPAMMRSDLLLFFQRRYYSKLPFGTIRFYSNFFIEGLKSYLSPLKPKIYTFEKSPRNIWNWMHKFKRG